MTKTDQSPRTVLVTGGSRGIGRACVKRFAENGDRVAFFYASREDDAQKTAMETGALPLRVDVSDPDAVREGVRRVREVFGPVSVLVNNAGISHIGLMTDLSNEVWDRIVGVNLSGTFFVTREVAPDMIREHCGRIVQIGSMWGKVGASCEVAYSATKAGLRGFTMALAKELGPSGVTVNCIEPGVISTDMNRTLGEETLSALADETPLSRLGTPEEVANAVFFLASPDAGFITGQILGVDGGFAV